MAPHLPGLSSSVQWPQFHLKTRRKNVIMQELVIFSFYSNFTVHWVSVLLYRPWPLLSLVLSLSLYLFLFFALTFSSSVHSFISLFYMNAQLRMLRIAHMRNGH